MQWHAQLCNGGVVLVEHARGRLQGLRGQIRWPPLDPLDAMTALLCPQVCGATAWLSQPCSTAGHPAELARRPPPPRLPGRRSSATGGHGAGLMGVGLRCLL